MSSSVLTSNITLHRGKRFLESGSDLIERFSLVKIKEWIDKNDPGAILIPFSGAFELRMAELDEEERAKQLQELNTTR
ncbi:Obg-like ATPase 1 [Portunus trituberculatus]|uniref:Obg-like ATPase 1 n=1 Tax=Portunus trituberculatus TaxID=210409 RepID=A0A5B7FC55_PORTR|nr:Obg-like ATPase 1 [Portunus trituberculatus]